MSSLLNPLHPGTLFIQKKLGQQFVASSQIIMPPISTLTYQIAPPSGKVWILAIRTQGTPRDFFTNNPVVSPLLSAYARHSMIVSSNQALGLESNFLFPWGIEIDLKTTDPLVVTVTNASTLTIIFDAMLAIMEITEDKYDQYMRLWNGLYNFEMVLGDLKDNDIENLVSLLKTLRPVIPLPVPVPAQETVTHPTLHEDVGRPIKRIEIP